MRTPQQVWDTTGEDTRWIDEPAAVLKEIMREAFAAGYADGAEVAADGIDGHVNRLGSNTSIMALPESVPRGLRALSVRMVETGIDPAAVEAAWRRCNLLRAEQRTRTPNRGN